MAQTYLPQDQRAREQLQSSVSSPAVSLPSREQERPSRRFGILAVLIILVFLSIVTFLVMAASRWAAPLQPLVTISLSPILLPVYAGYSLLRMLLAYMLSLLFTFVYGHIAATNRRAETVVLSLLRRSALTQRVFQPISSGLARLLNRLQPLPASTAQPTRGTRKLSARQVVNWILIAVLAIGIVYALWNMIVLLSKAI